MTLGVEICRNCVTRACKLAAGGGAEACLSILVGVVRVVDPYVHVLSLGVAAFR